MRKLVGAVAVMLLFAGCGDDKPKKSSSCPAWAFAITFSESQDELSPQDQAELDKYLKLFEENCLDE